MNKVLIVSDSHGLKEELTEIKARHSIDYMIHCGDSELDIDALEMADFYKVGGNCDLDHRYQDEQVIEIAGVNFLVVHGHLHSVKRDLSTLSYAAEEKEVSIICYGHTHIAAVNEFDNKLFINPGSIQSPRGINEKTYAILEWDTLEEVNVNYYNMEGRPSEKLKYKTSLIND